MPRLTGAVEAIARSQPMYWDFYTGQAMRMGDWKLWRDGDTTLLFNIGDDPAELANLAYQQPEAPLKWARSLMHGWPLCRPPRRTTPMDEAAG